MYTNKKHAFYLRGTVPKIPTKWELLRGLGKAQLSLAALQAELEHAKKRNMHSDTIACYERQIREAIEYREKETGER